jgi:hypothetical protein
LQVVVQMLSGQREKTFQILDGLLCGFNRLFVELDLRFKCLKCLFFLLDESLSVPVGIPLARSLYVFM